MPDNTVSIRIEADLASLKTQLAQAEAQVRQSLGSLSAGGAGRAFGFVSPQERQAQEQMAGAAKANADAMVRLGSAASGSAEGFRRLGHGVQDAGQQLRETIHIGRAFSEQLLGEIDPGIGRVAGGVAIATRALHGFGAGFVLAGVGAAAALTTLALVVQRLNQLNETRVTLNVAKAFGDLPTLNAELQKVVEEEEQIRVLNKAISEGGRVQEPSKVTAGAIAAGRRGFSWLIDLFTASSPEQRRAEAEAPISQAQGPVLEAAGARTNLQLLDAQRQALALSRDRAASEETIRALTASTVDNLETQLADETRIITLQKEAEQRILRARFRVEEGAEDRGPAAFQEAFRASEENARKMIEAREILFRAARRRELDTANQGVNALAALDTQRATGEIDRQRQRAVVTLTTQRQILEGERGLAEAQAAFEGRALGGLEEFQSARRRLVNEQLSEELAATEQRRQAEVSGIRERMARATPREAKALQSELTEAEGRAETERTRLLEEAAATRQRIQAQEFEERLRKIRAELQAEENAFRVRRAGGGGVPVTEEIQRQKGLAQDLRLPYQERLNAAEQAYQMELQLEEQLFSTRRALGQATTADEEEFWRRRSQRAEAGSQVQIQAEQRLAEVQRRQRDEAAQAAQGVLAIGAGGRKAFTQEDILQGFKTQQEQGEKTLAAFAGGGKVSAKALERAFGAAGVSAQLAGAGLSPQDALRMQVEQAQGGLRGETGLPGSGVQPPEIGPPRFVDPAGALAAKLDSGLPAIRAAFDRLVGTIKQPGAGTSQGIDVLEEFGEKILRMMADRLEEGARSMYGRDR